MKKFAFAAAVMASLSAPAFAADMYVKAPIAPPPTFNWSGFYIGGHIGWGWGDTDITDTNFISAIAGVPALQTVSTDGFIGGIQGGANYQIGKLVIGTEYDFSWSDVNGTSTAALTPIIVPGTATRSSNNNWFATATTRIGFAAWNRTLIYSKAGVAWAHFNYTDSVVLPGIAFAYNSASSEDRIGWTVGSGIEWMGWDKWSFKVEYDYMDFGTRTIALAPAVVFPIALSVDQRISVIKFGVNYALGGL